MVSLTRLFSNGWGSANTLCHGDTLRRVHTMSGISLCKGDTLRRVHTMSGISFCRCVEPA